MEQISFVIVGFLAGTLGTIIGIGGGLIVVPFLLLVYGFPAQQAAGTSLLMVFFNSLSGALAYAKQKRIDYRSAWKFALSTFPGAIAGSYITGYLGDKIFHLIFGITMILIAASILLRGEKRSMSRKRKVKNLKGGNNFLFKESVRMVVDAVGRKYLYLVKERLGILISFFVGFLSSALGIGGGIIHVPAMIYLLNFPTHIATATSQTILCVSAFGGTSSHFVLGNVNLMAAIFLSLGAVFGAQMGAFFSSRMKASRIIKLLAFALILTGIRLIFT